MDESYSASLDTAWLPFTPYHQQALDLARAIARGESAQPVGAIVGVYGSGKSTLLFTVLRETIARGTFAVWDEAAAFVDRLVSADERVTPQKFAQLVYQWLNNVQNDADIRHQYCCNLEERRHPAIAEAIRSATASTKNQTVLLLDEMEQASQLFLTRIETADRQPLRAWLDSCRESGLRILMSYAPESFHSLGDADKGRMRTIHIPSLDATSISRTFQMSKPMANFAWWASRGRARGVLKVRDDILLPFQQGLFHGSLHTLREACDGLPGIFGVPAVLRESLAGRDLEKLLQLVPYPTDSGESGVTLDIRDRPSVTDQLEEELAKVSGRSRHEIEAVIQELLEVLDATSDESYRCYLTFGDMAAAVKLAEARAVESGKLPEMLEGLDQQAIGVFCRVGNPGPLERALPFSLQRLAEEIFPSPFTDPALPLPDLKRPNLYQIEERYLAARPTDRPVFYSESRKCMIFHDIESFASWLVAGYTLLQSNPKRILLLERGIPSPLVELARVAGLVEYKEMPSFYSSFVKSLFLLSRQRSNSDDLDSLITDLRKDKQLSRKIDWHVTHFDQELESLRPIADSDWTQAIKVIRTGPFNDMLRTRLRQGSTGLLALLYPFKKATESNRALFSKLAENLAKDGRLRKLPMKNDAQSRLEGAAVIVDNLLPGFGDRKRWVESDFPGRRELRQILDKFSMIDHYETLAALLYPEQPERLKAFIEFYRGQLPSISSERQELNALRGLAGLQQRVKKVHDGISRLVGDKRAPRGLFSVGKFIELVWQANKELTRLQEIGAQAEQLKDPWAKTLALWICGVFAERIKSGVESEEATLREWEELAREGEEVGRQAEEVIRDIHKEGFTAIAESLQREQRDLRKFLDSPEDLKRTIDEFKGQIDAYVCLKDCYIDFRSVCAQLEIDLETSLRTYCPRPEDIGGFCKQLEQALPSIAELEEPPPAPTDAELATYVSQLERYTQESRKKRLQGRLAQVIQAKVADTIRVAAEDVQHIAQLWPTLGSTFQDACRQAVEQNNASGTDTIVGWIQEACEKQIYFSRWMSTRHDLLSPLDERIRAWATSVEVRPHALDRISQERDQIRQLLNNHPLRHVEAAVVQHFIDVAKLKNPGDIYSALVSAIQSFVQKLEDELNTLRELLSSDGKPKPLPGGTPEQVLHSLGTKLTEAQQERDQLYEKMQRLSSGMQSLKLQPEPVPSPLSLPEAHRLAGRFEARVRGELNNRQAQLQKELEALGLPSALLSGSAHHSLQEEIESYLTNQKECEQARVFIGQLDQLGATRASVQGVEWTSVFDALQDEVVNARSELETYRAQIGVFRRRVQRLEGSAALIAGAPVTNLLEARGLLKTLTEELEMSRKRRLDTASEKARKLYFALSEMPLAVEEKQFVPIFELRKLGLLKTVEDEV